MCVYLVEVDCTLLPCEIREPLEPNSPMAYLYNQQTEMSVCLRLKMWTRCLISPLFALFMSFHTILLFLEAYQIVHVLGQTHILTLKLTHLPIIPTSLFYHFRPLFSSSLVSSPPSFQARELTRVPSLMNNIDNVGFLNQTKTHLQPTYLEILILEYDTVLDRVSLYS